MAHVCVVSRLPQTVQARMVSAACRNAVASGSMRVSRFLIICRATRRAERGPKPGSRASNWMSRSISLMIIVNSGDP